MTAANDADNWIEAYNPDVTSSGTDETGSSASAAILAGAPRKKEPSASKKALGARSPEKPSDGHLNWILYWVCAWIEYFANGGSIILRSGIAAWKAVTRTFSGAELIQGQGWYRFDPDATDEPGEGFIPQDSGAGLGIIESAHPDAMAAMLAAFVPEILPPVQAVLNFDSVSAGAVGTPLTVTVPGAVVGDQVILGPPSGIDTGLMWAGFVSAANTVQIRLFNGTGSPINPAEATWSVTVVRPNSMPVITTRGLKIFVNLIGGVYDSTSLEADLGIADNEAAFNLLVNSRQHRAALLDGGTIEAIISGSATADAIILATGGY
ncbi:hypothetical protein COW64_22985 [bacterium (Candidatus Blackallbacteria) CG18_big_fil_WC_8_21_14_2_50_49_26]|nr:MAG: hypothetical protein COW64_22985 [bacterium (Candidatus Blackallbacteria) CG18_big_fil_WC_8_21_14_2_50_49_26]